MLEAILYILYGVLLLVFVVGAWRLRYAYTHFQMKSVATTPHESPDLPSVTVCIPARNEMHAMTECLERVIASNYPKLEIIVLDDHSRDDTSTLIKAYAHEGVRFVEGAALPEGWLGKNHALQGLLKHASGKYVLFMDVDTRLSPDSIGQLIEYTIREKAKMVSVLPRRTDGMRASVLFSTLRYFWEILFHRKESPATASNAWLIHRQTLVETWQGLSAFKSAIQPESRLSAALMASHEYRFVIGNERLGISYEKKWRSQVETSVRLLFPLLGSKASHGIIAFIDILIVASPLFVLLSGLVYGWGIHQLISGVIILMFAGLYYSYLSRVRTHGRILGALLWPIIIVQEAVLLVMSMERYERGAVTWKGRVINVPKK